MKFNKVKEELNKLKDENQKLKKIVRELIREKDKIEIIKKIENIKSNHSLTNLIKWTPIQPLGFF